MTQHAETRIKERFEQLGFKPKVIKESLNKIDELTKEYPKENVGLLLRQFDRPMVTDFSNGDELWLILRDGRPITCFLRRSTQTRNRNRSLEQQLQVDYTVRLNCLEDDGWKTVPTRESNRVTISQILNDIPPMIEGYDVPTIEDIPEITRRINRRDYVVMDAQELRDNGIRRDQQVICRMRSGNYVVVTNPRPVVGIESSPPSFEEVWHNYYSGGWIGNSINEDNTER